MGNVAELALLSSGGGAPAMGSILRLEPRLAPTPAKFGTASCGGSVGVELPIPEAAVVDAGANKLNTEAPSG